MADSEPLSELLQRQLPDWRRLRDLVKELLEKEARRAQELVNRHRPDKLIQEGDRVMWKDVKIGKERAGRTLCIVPLSVHEP